MSGWIDASGELGPKPQQWFRILRGENGPSIDDVVAVNTITGEVIRHRTIGGLLVVNEDSGCFETLAERYAEPLWLEIA